MLLLLLPAGCATVPIDGKESVGSKGSVETIHKQASGIFTTKLDAQYRTDVSNVFWGVKKSLRDAGWTILAERLVSQQGEVQGRSPEGVEVAATLERARAGQTRVVLELAGKFDDEPSAKRAGVDLIQNLSKALKLKPE